MRVVVFLLLSSVAVAQPNDKVKEPAKKATPPKRNSKGEQDIEIGKGLDALGKLRSPSLLYFLERANEELERASLEKRSFIPKMMRSLDEETL